MRAVNPRTAGAYFSSYAWPPGRGFFVYWCTWPAKRLGLADAVGRRIGQDRLDQWNVSGPTNVAIHAARAALDLGDPRKALKLAEKIPPSATLPAAWWVWHLLDVAHAQYALKRDEQAVATLLQIDRRAPRWLPYQGVARQIATEVRRREPPSRIRGLRKLLEVMGIDET